LVRDRSVLLVPLDGACQLIQDSVEGIQNLLQSKDIDSARESAQDRTQKAALAVRRQPNANRVRLQAEPEQIQVLPWSGLQGRGVGAPHC
jgi:hypothetical protein